ncbi:MAG: septal ring lytic transglycosylase RlpA family protein [Ignavibacteria bacterium]|nr:septal ring lytic transglycosylase RlpA family protein [Ignavibacteria bacterium]
MSKIKMMAGSFLVLVLINLISLSLISQVQAKTKEVSPDFVQVGEASWYGPGFQGRKTANGERFNTHEMTAAHKTLPFNTLIKVTNLHNEATVVVRINDRGPFIRGRIIDLSKAAKEEIGMGGLAQVKLEVYDPETEEQIEKEQENLAPVNLFDQVFPATSKIFVEWDGDSLAEGEISNEQLSSIFSASRIKIKVLTQDTEDASLNIYEKLPSNSGKNYLDITKKIKFITGYSIELATFDDEVKCNKLVSELETEKFKNIFLEEMYDGNKTQIKVLVGNYVTTEDSKEDMIRILETRPDLTTKLVMIGG